MTIVPGYILSSFVLAILIFPLFIKMLYRKQILDKSDERKLHERDVPLLGGFPVIISTMLTTLFFFPFDVLIELRYFFGTLFLMFLVGLRDDLLPLNPFVKFISQVIPCILVYFLLDTHIDSLYTLFPLEFPFWFSIFITVFTLLIIINSFNLIDGIDGLAGSLTLISVSAFATYFYFSGNEYLAYLLYSYAGAMLGFLIFNWAPARIFMGDTGSLFSGFLLGCSAIWFINANSEQELPYFQASIGTAMCFIAVPLFDTFRIIFYRIYKGKSPMSPDRQHIHHILLRLNFSHQKITLVFSILQLSLIGMSIAARNLGDLWVMGLLAFVLFSLLGLVLFSLPRPQEK